MPGMAQLPGQVLQLEVPTKAAGQKRRRPGRDHVHRPDLLQKKLISFPTQPLLLFSYVDEKARRRSKETFSAVGIVLVDKVVPSSRTDRDHEVQADMWRNQSDGRGLSILSGVYGVFEISCGYPRVEGWVLEDHMSLVQRRGAKSVTRVGEDLINAVGSRMAMDGDEEKAVNQILQPLTLCRLRGVLVPSAVAKHVLENQSDLVVPEAYLGTSHGTSRRPLGVSYRWTPAKSPGSGKLYDRTYAEAVQTLQSSAPDFVELLRIGYARSTVAVRILYAGQGWARVLSVCPYSNLYFGPGRHYLYDTLNKRRWAPWGSQGILEVLWAELVEGCRPPFCYKRSTSERRSRPLSPSGGPCCGWTTAARRLGFCGRRGFLD